MTSILEPLYNIIAVFFPADLLAIPFFEFLMNLFFFSVCCFFFLLFFCYPVYALFRWLKSLVGGAKSL